MEMFGVTDVRPRPRVGPANGVEGVVGGGGGWDIPNSSTAVEMSFRL